MGFLARDRRGQLLVTQAGCHGVGAGHVPVDYSMDCVAR